MCSSIYGRALTIHHFYLIVLSLIVSLGVLAMSKKRPLIWDYMYMHLKIRTDAKLPYVSCEVCPFLVEAKLVLVSVFIKHKNNLKVYEMYRISCQYRPLSLVI